MATRFYFQSTGSPSITPAFDTNWEQTGSAVRRPMTLKQKVAALTALTNSAAITIPITTTQDICAWQMIGTDVLKPCRLDTSVRFSMVIRCSENATTNNAFLAYSLRAFTPDGLTLLGTLASSLANTGTEFAVTASAATRIFGSATTVTLTATTLSELWIPVLDIGCHAEAPSAAGSFIQRIGSNAASDFALTSALTTDLNPWMELSINVNGHVFNNYHAPSAGSGIIVTDKWR